MGNQVLSECLGGRKEEEGRKQRRGSLEGFGGLVWGACDASSAGVVSAVQQNSWREIHGWSKTGQHTNGRMGSLSGSTVSILRRYDLLGLPPLKFALSQPFRV